MIGWEWSCSTIALYAFRNIEINSPQPKQAHIIPSFWGTSTANGSGGGLLA